jgi:hypothetical protein
MSDLDLTERLLSVFADEVLESRRECDKTGHQPMTYNPCHVLTYCRCGFVTHPGDLGVLPEPRVIRPVGKYDRDVFGGAS